VTRASRDANTPSGSHIELGMHTPSFAFLSSFGERTIRRSLLRSLNRPPAPRSSSVYRMMQSEASYIRSSLKNSGNIWQLLVQRIMAAGANRFR